MEIRRIILISILIALLPTISVQAQVATKHFEKDGLEFDYPAAWKITEGSGEDSQYAELATENKSTQLVVSWQFGAVLDCELEDVRTRITQAMVERLATQIHATIPPVTSWQQTKLGNTHSHQIALRGSLNNTPVIADIYSVAIKSRFLNLVYLRVADDGTANAAWETVQTTLKIAAPVPLAKGQKPTTEVLNGKAIRLPRPSYPVAARAAHVSGVVVVHVLISETGNVIAACALSGHNLLRDAAVVAAQQAQFSPTKLSGKPLRVTGILTYNFVAQ